MLSKLIFFLLPWPAMWESILQAKIAWSGIVPIRASIELDNMSQMLWTSLYLDLADVPDFNHSLSQVILLKWASSSTRTSLVQWQCHTMYSAVQFLHQPPYKWLPVYSYPQRYWKISLWTLLETIMVLFSGAWSSELSKKENLGEPRNVTSFLQVKQFHLGQLSELV